MASDNNKSTLVENENENATTKSELVFSEREHTQTSEHYNLRESARVGEARAREHVILFIDF